MGKIIELSGKRFGRLIVLKRSTRLGAAKQLIWICKCDCGSITEVQGQKLRSGESKSCGCYRRDLGVERHYKHGESNGGEKYSAEYRIWQGLKRRCDSPNVKAYPRYGGRGITVCKRWQQDFMAFIEDMGRRPDSTYSIDRINNNGNYEPSNCRWATPIEQANNRRPKSKNKSKESNG